MREELMYEFVEAFEGISAVSGLSSTLSVISYVFISLSIYTIAQRRGISKPWMAWVPVVNLWVWGSLSDQYRYVVKGQVKSKRKVLLVLNIATALAAATMLVWIIALMVKIISGTMAGRFMGVDEAQLMRSALGLAAVMLVMGIVSLVTAVFQYMALYDIYTSCDPKNNVLYLVLSIIPAISYVTLPLFLFLSRNMDQGMPPRRVVEAPAEPEM